MNLLKIRAMNSTKYCLALMDALFSDRQMAPACFARKKGNKPVLPREKTKLIQGK